MPTLTVDYPETLSDSAHLSRAEFESTMRFALAAKLFEMGRLSSAQAAQLIPLDRYHFLRALHQFDVKMIDWHPEEFADELRHA